MTKKRLHDKTFGPYLSAEDIAAQVERLGKEISSDYDGKRPMFVIVLNGAFMFAADLLKNVDLTVDLCFVKVSSYEGLETSGKVKSVIGLDRNLKGKDVIIVEDIVDTGITLDFLLNQMFEAEVGSVEVATLLFKKEAYTKSHELKYVGFEIPNNFVVGYGLDYDGLGRNINQILQLTDS